MSTEIDWSGILANEPAHDLEPLDTDPAAIEARMVAHEVRRLRVRKLAQQAVRDAERAEAEPFDAGTLAELLARPKPPRGRVEGLIPWEASALLVAQRKAGKTTATLNLARCLLTGERFLDRFDVRPVRGRVGLLNYEVSGAQLAAWADDHEVPDGRLFVVNLRGRRNPLDHEGDRAALADLLRAHEVETLIVDPFGRAYSGESQNDAAAVGQWLVGLDRFARSEVGALDLILTAHAGWNGERTRGSSALEDWADVIMTMTRDENTDARYLRAEGRDVELPEDRLDYDHETRTLSLSGDGSRKTAGATKRDAETAEDILDALADAPEGLSGKGLADTLERKDADLTRVRDALVRDGRITKERRPGRGGGMVYRLGDPEGTEHTEKVPSRHVPNLPNLPSSSGGSGSGGSKPEGTETETCPLHVTIPPQIEPCRFHGMTDTPGCYSCDLTHGREVTS